jgi:hypothetical protein
VLTIVDENATPHPSRAFAEAAWRQAPQLSPSWWRENLGLTHSKIVLDGRQALVPAAAWPFGVNVVLATPETQPPHLPAGVTALIETPEVQTPADFLLYRPATLQEEAVLADLHVLETRVAQGTLQAYGLATDDLASPTPMRPLHDWLTLAATAAEQAWGRKKRPALKILLAPLDVLDWTLLCAHTTQHRETAVSPLELAARLGLWVLVAPRAVPGTTASPLSLQALGLLAEAEATWHAQQQGQWPHLAGQPVFSVLKLLQAGQPPWPTPQAAALWQQQVWPPLAKVLANFPNASPLRAQWYATLPYVPELARAAAAPVVLAALQRLALPAPWAALPPELQQVALLASVPGVGAVVVPPGLACQPLLALPDYPDIGALLAR